MFSFFTSKNSAVKDKFPITTDMHCHLLPGIDDGAPDAATSIELIKGMQAMGISAATCTPHIISDLYPNNEETISAAFTILEAEIKKNNLDFRIRFAAEYQMDETFFEKLKNKEKLLTIKDNIILTEFASFSSPPVNMEEMAFEILTAGYIPILAHPERYGYFHQNTAMFHRMSELGFRLQPNISSITGYYGNAVTRATKYIIKNGLAVYIGTDLHHERGLKSMQEAVGLISKSFSDKLYNEELSF